MIEILCSFPMDLPMGNLQLCKILDTVKVSFKNKRGAYNSDKIFAKFQVCYPLKNGFVVWKYPASIEKSMHTHVVTIGIESGVADECVQV